MISTYGGPRFANLHEYGGNTHGNRFPKKEKTKFQIQTEFIDMDVFSRNLDLTLA